MPTGYTLAETVDPHVVALVAELRAAEDDASVIDWACVADNGEFTRNAERRGAKIARSGVAARTSTSGGRRKRAVSMAQAARR